VGIDPENQTLEFAENRSAMFTANVVTFLNNDPASLTFKINQFTNTGDNIYVDLDLTITHPLGNEGFNGYDVRGIFIGEGSGSFDSDPSLTFPDPYIDATLINADGYTRWFNLEEFFNDGLFGFTQGMYSTKNYNFTSDINPYKYFAAGLGAYDDLWPYLNATSDFGVFTYSSSQTRNYRINFPFPVPGIKYGYSIAADWGGIAPDKHPSNALEAVAFSATIGDGIYYVDESDNGGTLDLDVGIFDWSAQLSAGMMEEYRIKIESTVLGQPYEFTPSDMIPIDSSTHSYTYHISIPADFVVTTTGNELWVMVEYPDENYSNKFGIENSAQDEILTAYFRTGVPVSSVAPPAPVGFPYTAGSIDQDEGNGAAVDSMGNVYIAGYFWEQTDFDPTSNEDLHISNGEKDVFLTKLNKYGEYQWTKSWGSTEWDEARAVTTDNSGNIYVAGYIGGVCDFDPGEGEDFQPFDFGYDAFLSKFSANGDYLWARSWGGLIWEEARGVEPDNSGNVYISGLYMNNTDFDPGPGTENRSAVGGLDAYLLKLSDTSGEYQWVRTWGGSGIDRAYDICINDYGDIFTSGFFRQTVDFDPGAPVVEITSNGDDDIFVNCFDADGNFNWVRTFGGTGLDDAYGMACDPSGNVWTTGTFNDSVDFDPGPGDLILTSNGGDGDGFIAGLDKDGNIVNAFSWGSTGLDVGHELSVTPNGIIYTTGIFQNTVDFDPTGGIDNYPSINGTTDIFLSKIGTDGSYHWTATWGGIGDDLAFSVAGDSKDSAYVSGYFYDEVDFAPANPNCGEFQELNQSIGMQDIFFLKVLDNGCWNE
jgi:hypothetical protein